MMPTLWWIAPALTLVIAAVPPKERPEYAQAKQVAADVMGGTRTLLETQLAEAGPVGALDACSKVALDAARAHEQEGWRVRRVSLRLRNPADAPDPWEAGVLKTWDKAHKKQPLLPETEKSEVVKEGGREYLRYMKPIVIPGPLCLSCHGDPATMSSQVKTKLAELYPEDQATGHKVGDLRGAISVKIPLAPAAAH
jgi:hypothetical protein